jgi:hypothetical protein
MSTLVETRPTAGIRVERGLRAALVLVLASRVLLLVCGIVGLWVLPTHAGDGVWRGSPSTPWISMLSRWDGFWYVDIAQHGYNYDPLAASNIAFAPVLPSLMRVGGLLLGRGDADALAGTGIVVSNVALVAAVVYLFTLTRPSFGDDVALRTVAWLVLWPFSFYFSTVYPQALFLAFVVAAFFYARRDRWWLAGVLGALAAVTRQYGALVFVPLAVEYWCRWRRFRPEAGWLLLIPLTSVAWFVGLGMFTGDPLAVLHTEGRWARHLMPPWDTLRAFFSAPLTWGSDDHSPLDLIFLLVYTPLVLRAWRDTRASYALYATLLLGLPLVSGVLTSLPRFGLEWFPLFIVLARLISRRAILVPLLVLSFAADMVLFALFGVGWWIA